MGGLDVIEEDDVLQLHAVAHDAVRAHKGAAADEGAVAHLGVGTDDAGRSQIRGGEHLRRLMHPDVLADLLVILAQRGTEAEDERLDALERLPRVGELREVILRQRMIEVVEFADRIHAYSLSFFSMSRKYL